MSQAEPPGVQHRPSDILFLASVLGVPGNRVTERGQVNADLVRAACIELTAQKRMGSLPLDDLVARSGEAPARDHRHPFALSRMAADRTLEVARVVIDPSPDDGEISPAQRAVLELSGKVAMAHIVARDHDQPRRPFIESVDDARSCRTAYCGPGATPAEKGMHQRSGVVPGRRVYDHPGRLVDDSEVLVLVNDVQRDLLRAGLHDVSLRYLEVDDIPDFDAIRRSGGKTVEHGEVTLDQPPCRRPAELRDLLGEKAIEPRRRGRGDQPVGLRRRR